jgi:steroid delta-isomerase-like uncharacterized protein
MSMTEALDRYFDAWNARDGAAVVAALTEGGTYEDPTTGGPLSGDALAANVDGLAVGFPDLHFDIVSCDPTSDTSTAAQWRMTGTNTGATPMGPATGGSVDLPGADFITYDAAADRLSKVVGYFDTALMLQQLGVQVHLSPADMDPFLKFGLGIRVDTGRSTVPGAFSVTWIEIEPENEPALNDATEKIIVELLENPSYLGSCIATVGTRNWTFSAWESVDGAETALSRGAHAQAKELMRSGGVGETARGVTSIWQPVRLNHAVLPAQGRSVELSELTEQWL